MGRQIALLLFVFAAGGAVGYVVRAPGGDPLEISGGHAAAPAAPARADEAPLPELPRGAARDLSAAVARLPAPDLARSPEAIRGSLRTADGAPVAGVKIVARTWSESEPPEDDASFEEEVREYVKRRAYERAARAEATTGADGSFVLTGLADAKYQVSGESDDWTVSVKPPHREIRPGVELELLATPVATLEVTVLLPDDTEPKNATVCTSTPASARPYPNRNPWRPGQRKVRLAPGRYSVWATGGDLQELASAKQELELVAGERRPPLVLRLGDRPGIRGTVNLPEGEPAVNIAVLAAKLGAQESPEPKRLLEGATSRGVVRMDRGGAFAVPELAPGRYLVGVFDSNRLLAHAEVEVVDRPATVTLDVPAAERSSYAVVQVEGPNGKVLNDTNTWISVTWRSASRGGWGGEQGAVRQADGSFRAFFPEAPKVEEVPDCVWVLTVNSQSFGSRTVEFARTDATVVRVRMEEPAFVDAVLEGYAGSGCEGMVQLTTSTKESGSGAGGQPDADGRCRMGPLAPGSGTVHVMVSEPRKGRQMVVLRQEIDLRPGDNPVVLRLPPLHDLTVLLPEGSGQTHVTLMATEGDRGGNSSWARDDGSGKVVFERLPAGRYRLSVSGRQHGMMEVTVPAQSVVRFEPETYDCLRVRVTDPSGVLARAGFAEGDLVVAIDGTEFRDQRQMGALLSAAWVKEKSVFTVLRGGRTFTVEFAGTEVEKAGGPGGNLEPARR